MAGSIDPDEVVEAARLVVSTLQEIVGNPEAMTALEKIEVDENVTLADTTISALTAWADAAKGRQL